MTKLSSPNYCLDNTIHSCKQMKVKPGQASYLSIFINWTNQRFTWAFYCIKKIVLHDRNSAALWVLLLPTNTWSFRTEKLTTFLPLWFLLLKMHSLHVSHNFLAQFKCKNNSNEVVYDLMLTGEVCSPSSPAFWFKHVQSIKCTLSFRNYVKKCRLHHFIFM